MALDGFYSIVPFIGCVVWCGMSCFIFFCSTSTTSPNIDSFLSKGGLLAMIITWRAQGRPIYVSEDGTIPCTSIPTIYLNPLCSHRTRSHIRYWRRHPQATLHRRLRRHRRLLHALSDSRAMAPPLGSSNAEYAETREGVRKPCHLWSRPGGCRAHIIIDI